MRQIAYRAAAMLRDGKFGPTAIVTTEEMLFGMARMFSVFAEGVDVSADVFRDMNAAIAWLDDITR